MAKQPTLQLTSKYPLVLIEWEDSHGCASAWTFINLPLDATPTICQSVGWLVQDGETCKVIVPHLTISEHVREQGCGDMTIPTAAILRVVVLHEGKTTSKRKKG